MSTSTIIHIHRGNCTAVTLKHWLWLKHNIHSLVTKTEFREVRSVFARCWMEVSFKTCSKLLPSRGSSGKWVWWSDLDSQSRVWQTLPLQPPRLSQSQRSGISRALVGIWTVPRLELERESCRSRTIQTSLQLVIRIHLVFKSPGHSQISQGSIDRFGHKN